MTLKKFAINTAVVFGILALAFLVYEFREAVVLFIFSLAVAAATRPYVEALSHRGIPSGIAILLVYLLFIAFLVILFGAVGNTLLNELRRLADSTAVTYDMIWREWPNGTQFQQLIIRQLPPPTEFFKAFSPERQATAFGSLLGITMSSATFIGQFVTVMVLSIYWSIDRVHFERLWLSLLTVESRARARDIWRAIERDFGAYVRSEVLQSIIAGLLLGLGLWGMGIKYPTLLALFGALAWLVPWLGGVLVILPVALVGLSQSIGLGIFAPVYAIGVLFLLEFFIQPRFIRRRQFSSLLSLLLILALIEPFGLLGFIVAPPLAAAIELIFRYNLQSRFTPAHEESDELITQLRGRILRIRAVLSTSSQPPEPQMLNILGRLETLVDRADRAINE